MQSKMLNALEGCSEYYNVGFHSREMYNLLRDDIPQCREENGEGKGGDERNSLLVAD